MIHTINNDITSTQEQKIFFHLVFKIRVKLLGLSFESESIGK